MDNTKNAYPVLQRIDYDKPYLPGSTIMLTPEEAEPLRGLQVIGELEQVVADRAEPPHQLQQFAALQTALTEAEQMLARERAARAEEHAVHRDTLAAREQDLQASQTARAELASQLGEARSQLAQLGQEHEALKLSCQGLEAQVAELSKQLEAAATPAAGSKTKARG